MLAAGALAIVLASVAACGDNQSGGAVGESESSSPPLSSVPPPTATRPTGPPSTPSDRQPTGWIAGRVTQGGSGPCYGLETDDGIQYALYNADGITLETGAVVRVRVEPLLLRIYCGPGQHVHMLEVEILT
ncbi:MAG TPA: hypothetical protein VHO00_04180 [Actinomycetes bacterium]|jgi:hypothetical protein|nr:hypothetical protein [Actinomycetes bacterium]